MRLLRRHVAVPQAGSAYARYVATQLMGMSVQVSVVASAEWTNAVKPVVVIEMAREIQRAATPDPVSKLVMTVGAVGNVKPKLTTTVNELCATKVNSTVPLRVQLARFVTFV